MAKILVVGDLVIDRHVVLSRTERNFTPVGRERLFTWSHQIKVAGGAGNVATTLAVFGAPDTHVTLAGLLGPAHSDEYRDCLAADWQRHASAGPNRVHLTGVYGSSPAPEIARIFCPDEHGHRRMDIRIDSPQIGTARRTVDKRALVGALFDAHREDRFDALIIYDAGLGTLDGRVIHRIMAKAASEGVLVFVDAKDPGSYSQYSIEALLPNRTEAARMVSTPDLASHISRATKPWDAALSREIGTSLFTRFPRTRHVVVKLDSVGSVVFHRERSHSFDVTWIANDTHFAVADVTDDRIAHGDVYTAVFALELLRSRSAEPGTQRHGRPRDAAATRAATHASVACGIYRTLPLERTVTKADFDAHLAPRPSTISASARDAQLLPLASASTTEVIDLAVVATSALGRSVDLRRLEIAGVPGVFTASESYRQQVTVALRALQRGRLLILGGASGAGKSFLVQRMASAIGAGFREITHADVASPDRFRELLQTNPNDVWFWDECYTHLPLLKENWFVPLSSREWTEGHACLVVADATFEADSGRGGAGGTKSLLSEVVGRFKMVVLDGLEDRVSDVIVVLSAKIRTLIRSKDADPNARAYMSLDAVRYVLSSVKSKGYSGQEIKRMVSALESGFSVAARNRHYVVEFDRTDGDLVIRHADGPEAPHLLEIR